ncbi:MAG: cation:dicarboxylase symporter family transporter [Chlamydiales bacterium]|nr:cation:dicarboxylase symporter family transporter [Chlamydiales bacterium]
MKLSLPFQILIATLLGITVGIVFGESCEVFASWGSAYIMLMKITILPYLICAIIHGVGQFQAAQAWEILKKGALFIAIAWAVNIAMIYLAVFSFPQPAGEQLGSFMAEQPASLNIAELLIPENIFNSLSNNIVPAIVVFSLLIGIALIGIKEKQTLMSFLEGFVAALTRVTLWIAKITPIGTFLIIAYQVGTVDLATVKQVGSYLFLYVLTLAIIAFWIFPRLTGALTGMRASSWVKDLFPILLLAYTTNTVIVCLPYIIQLLERETRFSKEAQSQNQGIVSIVFNLPFASVFITIFIFFTAILYRSPLSLFSQLKLFLTTFLTSLGAIGIGSWLNSLTFLLDTLGLPLDAIDLYLLTLPFTAGLQSILSAVEIASVSLMITLACQHRIAFRWSKICRMGLLTLLPVLLVYGGLKNLKLLPEIQTEGHTICDIEMRGDVPVEVFTENPTPRPASKEDPFERILRTKILRVGYNPSTIPFCFYNSNGNLVGYDMAFAFELAHDLGCKLELVPLDYSKLAEEARSDLFDIGMSAISITEERLKEVTFSSPYLQSKLVFVVKDKRRKEFATVRAVLKNPEVRIAVLNRTSFVSLAERLFPQKQLVLLENEEEFANHPNADILLWAEQEAISWVIRHPFYTIVFPKPSLGIDSFGYLVKPDAPRLLNFLDQWLELKKNEGFTETQYNRWILGQKEKPANAERRWSLLNLSK